jgi:DNA-directed RNA polymerase subunit RPC12/RpoP
MGLVFHCSGCDARFEVDPALAGKKARCKQCGERTVVPRPEEAFALAPAGAPATQTPAAVAAAVVAAAKARSQPSRPMNWIEAVNSQVAMAPLTADGLPAFRRETKPKTPLDDASFEGLYKVASMVDMPAVRSGGGRSKPAGGLVIAYRSKLGGLQKFFRWLNESAYLISVPFLVLFLLAVVIHSRSLVYMTATVVVLLNIGRLVAGLANLVVIPFRDNPIQGLIFLIPPLTLIYPINNWKKMRKPLGRVVEPVLTVGLVVAAFAFVPWLHSGDAPKGDVGARLESGVAGLRKGMETRGVSLPEVDVSGVREKAGNAARDLEKKARNAIDATTTPPSSP